MSDPRAIFDACSNAGRWGPDDELGTLNLVDPAARLRGIAAVRSGIVVPLGRPLPMGGSTVATHPVVHRMLLPRDDVSAIDTVDVTPHDPQITHIDALGHTYLDGTAYNGRRQADVLTPQGLSALSVASQRDGILSRGVLLDVAAARGGPYLGADQYVHADDLERARERAGIQLEPGDAVVVHVGRAERLAAEGRPDTPAPRAGLHIDALPWLRRHDVSVFLGDCTERLPADDGPIPLPLHQIGSVAMGLCLIDGALTSELVATAGRLGRADFLLCCTVPELPGATGFPVNPVAVF